MTSLNDVTAGVAAYNSPDLLWQNYTGFRRFYPDMKLIVVDNSDDDAALEATFKIVTDRISDIVVPGWNINHGLAINMCVDMCETMYLLMMDVDVYFCKSGVIELFLDTIRPGMHCVSRKIGYHDDVAYAHPSLFLTDVEVFKKWPGADRSGSPLMPPMQAIHDAKADGMIAEVDGAKLAGRYGHYCHGSYTDKRPTKDMLPEFLWSNPWSNSL